MKIELLNQIIDINNSRAFIPYPYFDLNYSSNLILISNHLPLDEIDKEQLNQIVLRGGIQLLKQKYSGLGTNSDVVLDFLLSKINITKDLYTLSEGKKKKVY